MSMNRRGSTKYAKTPASPVEKQLQRYSPKGRKTLGSGRSLFKDEDDFAAKIYYTQ